MLDGARLFHSKCEAPADLQVYNGGVYRKSISRTGGAPSTSIREGVSLGGQPLGFSAGLRRLSGVTVIDVRGRLTLLEGNALYDLVLDLLAGHERKILLNLQNVTQINSDGVGALLRAQAAVQQQGGHMKITHRNSLVQVVLMTPAGNGLTVIPDERAAIISFG